MVGDGGFSLGTSPLLELLLLSMKLRGGDDSPGAVKGLSCTAPDPTLLPLLLLLLMPCMEVCGVLNGSGSGSTVEENSMSELSSSSRSA